MHDHECTRRGALQMGAAALTGVALGGCGQPPSSVGEAVPESPPSVSPSGKSSVKSDSPPESEAKTAEPSSPLRLEPGELPLTEPIVLRDGIAIFHSQFVKSGEKPKGFERDIEILRQLQPANCEYGAADFPVHPFICEGPSGDKKLTGSQILAALKVRKFQSKYMKALDAASFAYPGYHPGSNDEVHNDFREQYIFNNDLDPLSGNHGIIKKYVADQQVWYVLVHTTPKTIDGFAFSEYVVLFAVGKSPDGRLMGVVTQQVCHNLCD